MRMYFSKIKTPFDLKKPVTFPAIEVLIPKFDARFGKLAYICTIV